jgi:hypothetical protein
MTPFLVPAVTALSMLAAEGVATARVEPEEVGAIHLLDPRTGQLVPLEYRRGVNANRQSGFTNREMLEVPGLRSPVRFKAGTPLEFVVRVLVQAPGLMVWPTPPQLTVPKGPGGETVSMPENRLALVFKDPSNYDLLRLDPNAKSGNRELILNRKGFVNSTGSFGIFVLLKRWTDSSFHLRPAESLPPGEYAFKYGLTPEDCRELHAFGIDQ